MIKAKLLQTGYLLQVASQTSCQKWEFGEYLNLSYSQERVSIFPACYCAQLT